MLDSQLRYITHVTLSPMLSSQNIIFNAGFSVALHYSRYIIFNAGFSVTLHYLQCWILRTLSQMLDSQSHYIISNTGFSEHYLQCWVLRTLSPMLDSQNIISNAGFSITFLTQNRHWLLLPWLLDTMMEMVGGIK